MIEYFEKVTKKGNMRQYCKFNDIIFYQKDKYYVALKNDKYPTGLKLHQVIYMYYHKLTEFPKGYVIHHIDENRLNNDISNLQLLTRSEHQKLHNNKNFAIGGKFHNRKLSDETKLKISLARQKYEKSKITGGI
jgi:hypothetical protein